MNEKIDPKYYTLSKYILQCFAMSSTIESIKDTVLFKKEIKFHTNKLLDALIKEFNTEVFIKLFNIDNQGVVFAGVKAMEGVSCKIAKLNITETIILNNMLDDLISGDIPDKYKSPPIKDLNNEY
jgi:thiamine transporter ThiT